jgi:RNA polymerase sigma-70 factor (ECF subfamily)
MGEDLDHSPADSPAFATTHWSVIVTARDMSHPDYRSALARLCQLYWYPLYVYIRRKGVHLEEAEDLTQAFFADFLARNVVERADRNRGRFRSFLASSLENFLHNDWRTRTAQKRGGGLLPLSLDAHQAEDRYAAEPQDPETPDAAFARRWAHTLLDQTAQALEAEWKTQRRPDLFPELMAHLWSDANSIPYPELSARFDISPVNLRVTLHRFRQRYRDLLRQAVATTVADPEDVDDELRFLMQALSR